MLYRKEIRLEEFVCMKIYHMRLLYFLRYLLMIFFVKILPMVFTVHIKVEEINKKLRSDDLGIPADVTKR